MRGRSSDASTEWDFLDFASFHERNPPRGVCAAKQTTSIRPPLEARRMALLRPAGDAAGDARQALTAAADEGDDRDDLTLLCAGAAVVVVAAAVAAWCVLHQTSTKMQNRDVGSPELCVSLVPRLSPRWRPAWRSTQRRLGRGSRQLAPTWVLLALGRPFRCHGRRDEVQPRRFALRLGAGDQAGVAASPSTTAETSLPGATHVGLLDDDAGAEQAHDLGNGGTQQQGANDATHDLGHANPDGATCDLGHVNANDATCNLGHANPNDATCDLGRGGASLDAVDGKAPHDFVADCGGSSEEEIRTERSDAKDGAPHTRGVPTHETVWKTRRTRTEEEGGGGGWPGAGRQVLVWSRSRARGCRREKPAGLSQFRSGCPCAGRARALRHAHEHFTRSTSEVQRASGPRSRGQQAGSLGVQPEGGLVRLFILLPA